MIDWRGWTAWQPLLALDWDLVGRSPGAYAIATDRPIQRAVGADPEGVLHIGESANLCSRIWGFVCCVQDPTEECHMAGWRYTYFGLGKPFAPETLRVRWIETPTKPAAYRAEGRALRQYIADHFELPPLNYKFNWSSDAQEVGGGSPED